MPNLIHSIDAASLTLFADSFFKIDRVTVKNLYSIHDCFSVTADNVSTLLSELKSVYIYSNNNNLEKLNNEILNNIKNAYGENQFDSEKKSYYSYRRKST